MTERHLLVVRTVFLTCQAISLVLLGYTHYKVTAISKIKPPEGRQWPKDVPVRDGESMTKHEYDLSESNQTLLGALFSASVAALVHCWGYALTPLVLASIISIKNMHSRPLFRIHVMGHSDKMYRRPFGVFEAPPSIMMMFSDPEKYMDLISTPSPAMKKLQQGSRRRKKKLTGKEKREQRVLDRARAAGK